MNDSPIGEFPTYTLPTLRAMYLGSRDLGTMRTSLKIRAIVPGYEAAVWGRVIGLGSKLAIKADVGNDLIEDIRPEWVTYAEVVSR